MKMTELDKGKFGRLAVLDVFAKGSKLYYHCICDCGKEAFVLKSDLTTGKTKSCGCLKKEVVRSMRLAHGATTNRSRTPEYAAWVSMRERCYNSKHISYKYYGERGVKVCDKWINSFTDFLADVGPRPSQKHSLDRINYDGDYEPSNCRWADWSRQNRNKTNIKKHLYEGRWLSLSDLMEFSTVPYSCLRKRLQMGWSVQEALFKEKEVHKCAK